jgi:hypothetical protein
MDPSEICTIKTIEGREFRCNYRGLRKRPVDHETRYGVTIENDPDIGSHFVLREEGGQYYVVVPFTAVNNIVMTQ